MAAQHKELANRHAPAGRAVQRCCWLALVDVRLCQFDPIHEDRVVVDLTEIAADSDHTLDEWNVLTFLELTRRRLKDDNVTPLVVTPQWRNLVYQDVLPRLKSVLH